MYIFIVSPSPRNLQRKGRPLPRVTARGAEPSALHPRAAPDPRPNFAFCVVAVASSLVPCCFVRTSPEAG